MKCITFQKFSINHIFFLCYFICSFIRQRLKKPLLGDKRQLTGYFYEMYLTQLSHYYTVIPLLIMKCLSKSEKQDSKIGKHRGNSSTSTNINYLYYYDKIVNSIGKSKIKSTLLVSSFDFLAEACVAIFYFFNDNSEVYFYYSIRVYSIFNTVMQYIASYFILTNQLYRHHYLSILLNLISVIIFLIIDILKIINNGITEYQYYVFIFIKLLKLFFFSLGDNFAKYALISEFINPYSLELYKAVYKTVFLILFSIPFIFLNATDLHIQSSCVFTGFSVYFTDMRILYTFCFSIVQFLYDLFIIIIIDRFSPNHLTLAYALESFGDTIYTITENYAKKGTTDWLNYFNFCVYIIVFIGAMIYNEVFIINQCGLNLNTRLFLDLKFKEEKLRSGSFGNSDDEDDDKENNDSGLIESDYIIDMKPKKDLLSDNYSSSVND